MIFKILVLCTLFCAGSCFLNRHSAISSKHRRFSSAFYGNEWTQFVVPETQASNVAFQLKYEHPSGNMRDSRFKDPESDLLVQFIGTASCVASRTRGVSSLGLRYKGDIWLFDCGEGAQYGIRGSKLRIGSIRKIFITHLHGDHSFGLVGLLCTIGASLLSQVGTKTTKKNDIEPIDIYGPEGLRNFVRSMSQLSFSKSLAPHRIHELKAVRTRGRPAKETVLTMPHKSYSEFKGEDIFPDENGHYHVCDTSDVFVTAAPLVHTVPCLGYVFNEKPLRGSLRSSVVDPLIKKHQKALLKRPELLNNAQRLSAVLKQLGPDETYTLPDGQVLGRRDVMGEDKPGRKIAILGDTLDPSAIAPLAMDADLLIHEATNAYFAQEDVSYETFEKVTKNHGHSTPEMAGAFAARVRAKKLVLNHFSTMFKGDDSLESMRIMWAIEEMARNGTVLAHQGLEDLQEEQLGLTSQPVLQGPNDIIASWDQMILSVPHSARHLDEGNGGAGKAIKAHKQ